jgi:hypothetical protein
MTAQLNADPAKENDGIVETDQSADHLAEVLDDLQVELRVTKRLASASAHCRKQKILPDFCQFQTAQSS